MSALITLPRWILGTGSPSTLAIHFRRRGDVGDGDVDAVGAQHAVRVSRARLRRAALFERRQMLEKEDRQRILCVREPRRAPPEIAPRGRPAPALDGVAHLDAPAPHCEHVGG
jgi:hypothetical protein